MMKTSIIIYYPDGFALKIPHMYVQHSVEFNIASRAVYDEFHEDIKDGFSLKHHLIVLSDFFNDILLRKDMLIYFGYLLGELEYINSDYCCGPTDNANECHARDSIIKFIQTKLFNFDGIKLRNLILKLFDDIRGN